MTAPLLSESVWAPVRLGRLALLFLAHAVGTANITLVLALAPSLERTLSLTHAGFGLLVSAYYGALLICALPAGWLVDRLGLRWVLITAHALMAIGMTIIAWAPTALAIAPGLFFCGIGYALVNPSTARAVLLWFPARGRATAMGVKQTGVPAGGMIAAFAAAAAGGAWREAALIFAVVSLIASIPFLLLRVGLVAGTVVKLIDLRTLLRRRALVLFNAGSCFYAAAQGAFFAYLVLFVTDIGANATFAAFCLAAAHAASAVGRVVWGMISDLLPGASRRACIMACGIVAVAGVLLLPAASTLSTSTGLVGLAMLLGATLGAYAGLTQTAALESVEPPLAGAAIGYNMLLTTVGLILGPPTFGAVIQVSGYAAGWIMVACLVTIGAGLYHFSGSRPSR